MLRFTELVRAGDDAVPDRLALLEAHDAHIEARVARLRDCQTQVRVKIDHYRGVLAAPEPDTASTG
jgi:hypothetical protein